MWRGVEMTPGEEQHYAAAEAEHFGDYDKQTGIYAPQEIARPKFSLWKRLRRKLGGLCWLFGHQFYENEAETWCVCGFCQAEYRREHRGKSWKQTASPADQG